MLFQIILLFLVVLVLVFLLIKFVLAPEKVNNLAKGEVCFNQVCFSVEIAKTQAQKDFGLMGRESLDADKGMLFIFDKEGIYSFWMKNTLIPLDIIWINSNGKVVFIAENVQPCPFNLSKALICPSIIPSARAKYVLEINAGLVEKYKLKIGDLVKITPGL